MDFHAMKRKELQALCKQHKIPANLSNAEMAKRLSSLLIVDEEDSLEEQAQPCLKDGDGEQTRAVDEKVEEDSMAKPAAKKVKFSPQNETFEFVRSDPRAIRLAARRRRSVALKSNATEKNPEIKAEPSRKTRSKFNQEEDVAGAIPYIAADEDLAAEMKNVRKTRTRKSADDSVDAKMDLAHGPVKKELAEKRREEEECVKGADEDLTTEKKNVRMTRTRKRAHDSVDEKLDLAHGAVKKELAGNVREEEEGFNGADKDLAIEKKNVRTTRTRKRANDSGDDMTDLAHGVVEKELEEKRREEEKGVNVVDEDLAIERKNVRSTRTRKRANESLAADKMALAHESVEKELEEKRREQEGVNGAAEVLATERKNLRQTRTRKRANDSFADKMELSDGAVEKKLEEKHRKEEISLNGADEELDMERKNLRQTRTRKRANDSVNDEMDHSHGAVEKELEEKCREEKKCVNGDEMAIDKKNLRQTKTRKRAPNSVDDEKELAPGAVEKEVEEKRRKEEEGVTEAKLIPKRSSRRTLPNTEITVSLDKAVDRLQPLVVAERRPTRTRTKNHWNEKKSKEMEEEEEEKDNGAAQKGTRRIQKRCSVVNQVKVSVNEQKPQRRSTRNSMVVVASRGDKTEDTATIVGEEKVCEESSVGDAVDVEMAQEEELDTEKMDKEIVTEDYEPPAKKGNSEVVGGVNNETSVVRSPAAANVSVGLTKVSEAVEEKQPPSDVSATVTHEASVTEEGLHNDTSPEALHVRQEVDGYMEAEDGDLNPTPATSENLLLKCVSEEAGSVLEQDVQELTEGVDKDSTLKEKASEEPQLLGSKDSPAVDVIGPKNGNEENNEDPALLEINRLTHSKRKRSPKVGGESSNFSSQEMQQLQFQEDDNHGPFEDIDVDGLLEYTREPAAAANHTNDQIEIHYYPPTTTCFHDGLATEMNYLRPEGWKTGSTALSDVHINEPGSSSFKTETCHKAEKIEADVGCNVSHSLSPHKSSTETSPLTVNDTLIVEKSPAVTTNQLDAKKMEATPAITRTSYDTENDSAFEDSDPLCFSQLNVMSSPEDRFGQSSPASDALLCNVTSSPKEKRPDAEGKYDVILEEKELKSGSDIAPELVNSEYDEKVADMLDIAENSLTTEGQDVIELVKTDKGEEADENMPPKKVEGNLASEEQSAVEAENDNEMGSYSATSNKSQLLLDSLMVEMSSAVVEAEIQRAVEDSNLQGCCSQTRWMSPDACPSSDTLCNLTRAAQENKPEAEGNFGMILKVTEDIKNVSELQRFDIDEEHGPVEEDLASEDQPSSAEDEDNEKVDTPGGIDSINAEVQSEMASANFKSEIHGNVADMVDIDVEQDQVEPFAADKGEKVLTSEDQLPKAEDEDNEKADTLKETDTIDAEVGNEMPVEVRSENDKKVADMFDITEEQDSVESADTPEEKETMDAEVESEMPPGHVKSGNDDIMADKVDIGVEQDLVEPFAADRVEKVLASLDQLLKAEEEDNENADSHKEVDTVDVEVGSDIPVLSENEVMVAAMFNIAEEQVSFKSADTPLERETMDAEFQSEMMTPGHVNSENDVNVADMSDIGEDQDLVEPFAADKVQQVLASEDQPPEAKEEDNENADIPVEVDTINAEVGIEMPFGGVVSENEEKVADMFDIAMDAEVGSVMSPGSVKSEIDENLADDIGLEQDPELSFASSKVGKGLGSEDHSPIAEDEDNETEDIPQEKDSIVAEAGCQMPLGFVKSENDVKVAGSFDLGEKQDSVETFATDKAEDESASENPPVMADDEDNEKANTANVKDSVDEEVDFLRSTADSIIFLLEDSMKQEARKFTGDLRLDLSSGADDGSRTCSFKKGVLNELNNAEILADKRVSEYTDEDCPQSEDKAEFPMTAFSNAENQMIDESSTPEKELPGERDHKELVFEAGRWDSNPSLVQLAIVENDAWQTSLISDKDELRVSSSGNIEEPFTCDRGTRSNLKETMSSRFDDAPRSEKRMKITAQEESECSKQQSPFKEDADDVRPNGTCSSMKQAAIISEQTDQVRDDGSEDKTCTYGLDSLFETPTVSKDKRIDYRFDGSLEDKTLAGIASLFTSPDAGVNKKVADQEVMITASASRPIQFPELGGQGVTEEMGYLEDKTWLSGIGSLFKSPETGEEKMICDQILITASASRSIHFPELGGLAVTEDTVMHGGCPEESGARNASVNELQNGENVHESRTVLNRCDELFGESGEEHDDSITEAISIGSPSEVSGSNVEVMEVDKVEALGLESGSTEVRETIFQGEDEHDFTETEEVCSDCEEETMEDVMMDTDIDLFNGTSKKLKLSPSSSSKVYQYQQPETLDKVVDFEFTQWEMDLLSMDYGHKDNPRVTDPIYEVAEAIMFNTEKVHEMEQLNVSQRGEIKIDNGNFIVLPVDIQGESLNSESAQLDACDASLVCSEHSGDNSSVKETTTVKAQEEIADVFDAKSCAPTPAKSSFVIQENLREHGEVRKYGSAIPKKLASWVDEKSSKDRRNIDIFATPAKKLIQTTDKENYTPSVKGVNAATAAVPPSGRKRKALGELQQQ